MENIETSNYNQNEYIREDKKFFRRLLQIIDGQSRIIRWGEKGELKFLTPEEVKNRKETVGEHCGEMVAITSFIFDKAEAEGDESITRLNFRKIISKINTHDTAEILTGDIRVKKDADREREVAAQGELYKEAGELNIGPSVIENMKEYENKQTPEDRFVKAIDELQAWIHMIITRTIANSKHEHSLSKKDKIKGYVYSNEFPTLRRIMDITLHCINRPQLLDKEIMDMNT